MFGFVVAERSSLTEEALLRYRGCYCGLCKQIGRDFGNLQRAALNYDMTFLVLLLSSLYEPEEKHSTDRCLIHPAAPSIHWNTIFTAYAAAMNVALAYHNCMDDWHDEKKLKARALACVFHSGADSVAKQYPRQYKAILTCMETLQDIEQHDLQDPDAGSAAFGQLMEELFVFQEDRWSDLLRQMGNSLGRFIYLLDALLDLKQDLQTTSYNPFRQRAADGINIEDYLPVLKQLLGDCTDAMERLPLLQDLDILRNILYCGIWTRYFQYLEQQKKEADHVR